MAASPYNDSWIPVGKKAELYDADERVREYIQSSYDALKKATSTLTFPNGKLVPPKDRTYQLRRAVGYYRRANDYLIDFTLKFEPLLKQEVEKMNAAHYPYYPYIHGVHMHYVITLLKRDLKQHEKLPSHGIDDL